MRLRPFILCFNRTGKQGATISETGHGQEGNTHPKRLSSSSSERYSPGLFIHRPQPPQRSFQRALAGHTPPHPRTAHTAAHRAKHGAFQVGVLSLPSDRFVWVGDPARPDGRTVYFAAFGPWSGVLPENAESLRNSDALMRVAVARRRGPAGLRDPIAVSLTALIGFTVLADRDYRVRKKAHFVFMRRAVLPALPAPSAALLYALMH